MQFRSTMDSSLAGHAIDVFRERGGILRTKEAVEQGIHPRTLYQLRDQGALDRLSRGLYRLTSLPDLSQPDLVTVALRVPRAVVCLVSALTYHDATSEVPHATQIAVARGTKSPHLEHPPIRVFHFSGSALTAGIDVVQIDGVDVRIYGLAKTVVDCFRFRNKLGTDVAVEALIEAIRHKGIRPDEVLRYARLCRVETVVKTYLEALV